MRTVSVEMQIVFIGAIVLLYGMSVLYSGSWLAEKIKSLRKNKNK